MYLACPGGTGMYQSDRQQFLVYSVLPIGSGEALSQAGANGMGN